MFKKLRITILFFILFLVAMNAWLTKLEVTDWDHPLRVVIYPINGDNSETSKKYISNLTIGHFATIEQFFLDEATRYGIAIREPVDIKLSSEVVERPPDIPANSNIFSVMLWSLRLRYWANNADNYDGPQPDVRMFLTYYDPNVYLSLDHSVGMEKGLIGVVKAFSSRKLTSQNNVIIAHELLHTIGATDKYSPPNNLPIHPDGYANPDQNPLYPQEKAEIMGGRIPVSRYKAEIPPNLSYTVIGPKTAEEINWL